MQKPLAIITTDEDMPSVMKKLDETDAWNEQGKYVGFISKSSLLTKYHSAQIKTSTD